MKRNGLFVKMVSFVVAVSFLWSNAVWAGGLSAVRCPLPSDKLAAVSGITKFSAAADELQLGGIVLRVIAEHAVNSNLDLHRKWRGQDGVSKDIRSVAAGKKEGFKICFSGSSVYLIRGAFLHRYSIDNQTEDPLYISALRQYEDNPDINVFDEDIVLAGKKRRLKIFLITPEIHTYLEDISQYMVGNLDEVISAYSKFKATQSATIKYKTIIAIDGPAGTGKSTVAKLLAKRLGYLYLDTGAMYRAVTLEVIRRNVDISDTSAIEKLVEKIDIKLVPGRKGSVIVYLNGIDVSYAIRTEEISKLVPKVARINAVRKRLVQLQRKIAIKYNVVAEGRDIGTIVFPAATVKIYMDASPEVRAERRYKELKEDGADITLEKVLEGIKERDREDMERTIAPLKKAKDAVVVDTTSYNIKDVLNRLLNIVVEILPEFKKQENSPDMDLHKLSIPHREVNAYIRENHFLGKTIFIKDSKVYRISLDTSGNPRFDSEGNYVLEEADGREYAGLMDKINRAKEIFSNKFEQLFDELRIRQDKRKGKENQLKNLILVLVKGEMFVGRDKNIIAHAGRRRGQITLGKYLVDMLDAEQLADLMYEEAKHIIFPKKQHKSAKHPNGIEHNEELIKQIKKLADEFLVIKAEKDLREMYYREGMDKLRGAPWLGLYLNSGIIKDVKLKTALETLKNEFNSAEYNAADYFTKIDEVFKKYYGFNPSETGWQSSPVKIKNVLQYYRAINPVFWLNYSFVRDNLYKGSDRRAISAYLDTAKKTGFTFVKVVCGIAEAEDAQRPLDPAGAGKVIRGPPRSTDFTYIGGGGWTPTDFGWLFTRGDEYIKDKIGDVVVTLISNTQDDGGRTRKLQDQIRELWNMYTTAAGDGVILAWITGNVAKMFMMYKDAFFHRDGNLSRIFNIKKIEPKDKKIIDLIYLPLSKILNKGQFDEFIGSLLLQKDSLSEGNLEEKVKESVREALLKGNIEEDEIDKKQGQVWNVLKNQLRVEGEHILDPESSIKEMILEAEKAIKDKKDIEFKHRNYGGYTKPFDWLYFTANMLSLARMAQRELIDTGINDFQNMSWMNTYTILGLLASRMIQRGNKQAGQQGRMRNDKITTAFFNEMFGIENGFWAPSTFDETTMGMVCEGVGIRLKNDSGEEVGLVVGKREDGKVVIGKNHTFKLIGKEVQTTTKLERLADPLILTDKWEGYAGLPVKLEVKLSKRNTILFRFDGHIYELSDYVDKDGNVEEGKTIYSLDGGDDVLLRTDAMWQKVGEQNGYKLFLRSQLVEEQTKITDTPDLHPSPIKKLIWKRAAWDKDGKRYYRNIRPDEAPRTDQTALNLVRNTKKMVFCAQSSLVTSTMPNFLTVGMVDELKKLRAKGIPVIYLLKPATDIETLGLTYSEQLRVFERSIQAFLRDPEFRISDIFSYVIIPDIDSLSSEVKDEFNASFKEKKEMCEQKMPLVLAGTEKLSKILPMGPLSVVYRHKDYPGKKEDNEYLENLKNNGVNVTWTQSVRVFNGKYVYDEKKLVNECLRLSRVSRMKNILKNEYKKDFSPISSWDKIFKELEDPNIWPEEDVAEINIGYCKSGNSGYRFTLRVPSEEMLKEDKELRQMVLKYLSVYVYNRLATLGAEKIYIGVKGIPDVKDSIIGKFLIGRFSFDRKLMAIVAGNRDYPDRPYKFIYNYVSRVNDAGRDLEIVYDGTGEKIKGLTLPAEGQSVDISGLKNSGSYIGLDIGASDVKVIAIKEGEIVFSKEYKWDPEKYKTVDEHMKVLIPAINEAKTAVESKGGAVSGIGISVNLAVKNEKVTGLGPLVSGVEKTGNIAELEKIKDLRGEISRRYNNIPVAIANDGDMSALWVAQDMGLKDVLVFSLGSGLASGYIDSKGTLLDILGEMGNVVIDMSETAFAHSVTGMKGAIQMYLSQRPIITEGALAYKAGLYLRSIAYEEYREKEGWKEKFTYKNKETGEEKKIKTPNEIGEISKAVLLEVAQDLLENGTEEQKQIMENIFRMIGRYLAEAIMEINNYLQIKDVVIMGRVTKGKGGEIVKATAQEILDELGIDVKIYFPKLGGDGDEDWYKRFGQAVGATYLIMQKIKLDATQAHPISRKGEGREETRLFSIEVRQDGGLKSDSFEIEDHQLQQKADNYYSLDMLGRVLNKLAGYYGEGVYRFIQEIDVVDNINGLRIDDEVGLAELVDSKVKVDIDAFRSEALLFDVLEHEFMHNILGLLRINEGTDEVTATYRSVMRFLNEGDDYRTEMLTVLKAEDNGLDLSGNYARLLIRMQELQKKGKLTDAKVISAVVKYLLTTPRYEDLKDRLGIYDREIWSETVRQTEERMEAVLDVYDGLIKAKNEDSEGVGEKIVSRAKEAEGLRVKVIKTFNGVRILGLDKLSRQLAGMIAVGVKLAGKMRELAGGPVAMTEGKYCIVLDKDRIPKEMKDKWKEEKAELEKNGVFKVVYSVDAVPEGYKSVYLIDPADIKEEKDMLKSILYLPMPYLRSSLYMAAQVVISDGDVNKLNPLARGLISDLYSYILGREVTADDMKNLFKRPWLLLPEIRSVSGEINNLRTALVEIEKAA